MSSHASFWERVFSDPVTQKQLLVGMAIFLVFVAAGVLLRAWLRSYARRAAARTQSDFDDFMVVALQPPIAVLFLTLGLWLGFQQMSPAFPTNWRLDTVFYSLFVLLLAYTAGRTLQALIHFAVRRRPQARFVETVTGRIFFIVAYAVGLIIIMRSWGVEITPLLTSLGIAGLAVALALQDTLANVFAGWWIQSGKVIRPGYYVKVEDVNQEGWISEIGWRTTRILTRKNNLVTLPNTVMAKSVITNYDFPQPDQAAILEVGVSYDSDPEHVERVLLHVANEAAGEVENLRLEPPPIVRFNGFEDFYLPFILIVRVEQYVDQFAVLHELRKRVFKAFREEGIVIPFPIRTIQMADAAGSSVPPSLGRSPGEDPDDAAGPGDGASE